MVRETVVGFFDVWFGSLVVEVVMSKDDACRFVYVGDDGDVYEAGSESPPKRLTWGWSDTTAGGRLYYVWPSYSPDGAHIACFGVRTGSTPEAGLYAVADDGVLMQQVWRMTEAAPVCENWSPDSRHIALLVQNQSELQLEIADIRNPGPTITLDRGAPLFWSWSPSTPHIAVHTGGSRSLYEDARLQIFRLEDGCEEVAYLTPGEFRTPTWSPDGTRLAYVDASRDGREFLAFHHLSDGNTELVCPVEGQTVTLWSPDGRTVAVGEARGDSPHVYEGVTLVDVETGTTRMLDTGDLVSFFWSPCSTRLVSIAFDERRGMRWGVHGLDGSRRRLSTSFYPSRELVYFCWFFDQFADSHPLISPDGSRLVFAGHVAEHGTSAAAARGGNSNVYVLSLDDGDDVQRVGAGHFGCWDARLRPAAA